LITAVFPAALYLLTFNKSRPVWLVILALGITVSTLAGKLALSSEASQWLAQPVTSLPPAIELEEKLWGEATPLYLPLHAGSHGPRTVETVELRALYDGTTIAFRARWKGTATAQLSERFALIWHKDELPGQRGQDCATACHVAQSNNAGNIQTVSPSFVPAGREEAMATQASWRDGIWTLTWSRPLKSPEARDIQFADLRQRYRVRAKVFLELNDKPDLLTEDTYLIFDQKE
jgi:hypothetical protein